MREALQTSTGTGCAGSAIAWPPVVRARAEGPCRLYTATLAFAADGGEVSVVHACRVSSAGEVVGRLAARIGSTLARAATVRPGIDPLHPIVVDLLGAETARHLGDHGDLPGGALLGGGDLHVVQRRG